MTMNEQTSDSLVPAASAMAGRAPARVLGGINHLGEYLELAERVSRTAMVPSALRGKPDEVLAVVLYGAELGIGPMQALQQVNFIAGKPSASAELLRALVLEAGHQFIVTTTRESATARCKRRDWDEWQETSFTVDDATVAELHGDGWRKYADQMLAARVTSKACRMWFPDVISGMSYTGEEIESFAPPTQLHQSSTPTPHCDDETGEAATEEQMYALTTSLGLLDEEDQASVKALWIGAQLPPLARGLTTSQADRAIELVSRVLNAATDAVVVADVIEPGGQPAGELATTTQVRAIQTLLGKLQIGAADRHAYVGEIAEHAIASMNELTKAEATTVIDILKEREQQ